MPDPRAIGLVCGLILALLPGLNVAGSAREADEQTSTGLNQLLTRLRESAGLERLDRSEALQRLATKRARSIAYAPAERRLPHPVPLDDELDAWPALQEGFITERVVIVPASSTASELIRSAWDNPEAGAPALDAATTAVGLGAWFADDDALIFVALFQTLELLGVEAIEQFLSDEINEIRNAHGRVALIENDRLREVARAHSAAMLAENFFGHESPDGSRPADRVRAAGLPFRLVGENVARSQRPLGTIHGVVDEWMASPGHRANILTPDFRSTAVGAVLTPDGAVYITQLFLEP